MDEIQESTMTGATDDWDDITLDDLTIEPDDDEEDGESAEATEADQPTEQADDREPEAEAEGQEPDKEADQLFELKHLDETRTVGREEVIALAQKGMDYDRIREKYDAAKPTLEWYEKNSYTLKGFEDMAKDQGMTLDELLDETRAEIMAQKTNKSVDVCRGIVANERKAAELDAKSKAMDTKATADTAQAKMEADVKAFVEAYPEVAKDPNGIPKEVWDAVNGKGESLVNAYRAWENKQLKAQLEKEKADAARRAQEQKNKARSTGSQSTAGKRADGDAFDAAWYNGD